VHGNAPAILEGSEAWLEGRSYLTSLTQCPSYFLHGFPF
jgi:hypothetical protein